MQAVVERVPLGVVPGILLDRFQRDQAHPVDGEPVEVLGHRREVALRLGRRRFVARKEPKSHGMKKLIEGDVREGDRVIIVDDVITSGTSTIEAIQKSRDAGLVVTQALAIIDRGEQDGKARIEAEGIRVDALCTMRQLQDLVGMKD